MIEHPDDAIEPAETATAHRVVIRRFRPAEPDDIHRQDAEQRKSAQHVHRRDSLVRRHRLRPGSRVFVGNRLRIEHRRNERLGFDGHDITSLKIFVGKDFIRRMQLL